MCVCVEREKSDRERQRQGLRERFMVEKKGRRQREKLREEVMVERERDKQLGRSRWLAHGNFVQRRDGRKRCQYENVIILTS